MLVMRRGIAAVASLLLIAGCTAGEDVVSTDRLDLDADDAVPEQDVVPSDAIGEVPPTGPGSTAPPSTAVELGTVPTVEPPSDVGSGVFAENGAAELAVVVLRTPATNDDAEAPLVGSAIDLANADADFAGSPFELGGLLSAPIVSGENDLAGEPEQLQGRIDELLVAEADLFVGAVPPTLVANTTELAAEREVPLVIVNHIAGASGADDRRAIRLDLGGTLDLELRAMVAAVVSGEHDGIVLVGSTGDPTTERVEQLLFEVGADPVVVDAIAAPSADALAVARAQIAAVGERPAVVLVSEPWAAPTIDTLLASGSEAQFFASDLSLSRTSVDTLASFASNQLVVVRRVDDLRRPEVEEFATRLANGSPEGASTTFAALSYDAYALAAIAAVSLGSADGATLRQGMIEASRTGEPCAELNDCLVLAGNGVDVDYDGLSGPLDLDDDGAATVAWFSVDVVDPVTRGAASSAFVLQRS